MHHTTTTAILAAAACATLASAASAQYSLTVLHNNDGESNISAVDEFVTLVDETRNFYNNQGHGVLTLYAGDSIIPSPEFQASLESGPAGSRTFYDALALDAIGYDAAAIGNHEFDAGPSVFGEFLDDTSVPFLSANLDVSGEAALAGRSDILPSVIVPVATAAGTKNVGIVGATTQNLPFITSTGGVAVNDVVSSVNAEVASLVAAGVDNVILVSHLQGIGEDISLSSSLSSDIDLIVAGGGDEYLADTTAPSPSSIYGAGAPASIVDTGTGGLTVNQTSFPNTAGSIPVVTGPGDYQTLGRITLDFDAAGNFVGIDPSSNPQLNEGFASDPSTQVNVVQPVEDFVAGLEAVVIATSSQVLPGNSDRDVIRAEEAGLGNLVAATDTAGDFGVPVPDFAFVNGGGIRDDIGDLDNPTTPVDITLKTTFDVSPFGNIVSVVEDVTASDLKLIFENAYSRTADSDPGPGVEPDRANVGGTGRFLQVSEGVEIVYDITAQPLTFQQDDPTTPEDESVLLATSGDRIQSIVINGVTVVENGMVVDPSLTFDIATADFLARGGDQIFNSDDALFLSQDYSFTRLGLTDQNALQDYIEQLAMGDIGFDIASDSRYDNIADGRIVAIPANPQWLYVAEVAIPEPATAGLLATVGGLLLRRRRN